MNINDISTAPIVRRYRIIASITVGAVIFLIFVGGLVRMTGSGMGCPDWPKCFGQWVPPTDISQLPADYKTQFAVQGREIADFDPVKTWIEYINRLIGVLIGFFALLTLVFSIPMRKIHPRYLWTSLIAFISVGVEGWIGSIVVKTDLAGGFITLHMLVAMLILSMYIWGLISSYSFSISEETGKQTITAVFLWSVLFLVVGQIVLGTQVREEIDVLAKTIGEAERANWISQLGAIYSVHSFYYLIAAAIVGLIFHLRRYQSDIPILQRLSIVIVILLVGEVILGIGMHRLGIPRIMQPLHLLLATTLFGALFSQLTIWSKAKIE
ncbi:MAG: COX15/CtaA family protein [Bacteroidota bacterium]